jgi:hypothetical protein
MTLKKPVPNRSIHKNEYEMNNGVLKRLNRRMHKNIFIQNIFLNNAKRTLNNSKV